MEWRTAGQLSDLHPGERSAASGGLSVAAPPPGASFLCFPRKTKARAETRACLSPLSSSVTHLSVWLSSGCLSSRNSGGTLLPPSLIFLGEGDLEAGSGMCVYVCVRGAHTPQKLEKCRTFSGREPRARGSGRSEPRNLSVGRGRCWGAGGSEGGAGGFQIIPESLNPAPPGEEFVKGRERADAPHYRLPGHLSGALKESKH